MGNSTLNSFTICCLKVNHEYFPSISPLIGMVNAQTQAFKGSAQGGCWKGSTRTLAVLEWESGSS